MFAHNKWMQVSTQQMDASEHSGMLWISHVYIYMQESLQPITFLNNTFATHTLTPIFNENTAILLTD